MTFPRLLAIVAVLLFGTVTVFALFKGKKEEAPVARAPQEINLQQEPAIITSTIETPAVAVATTPPVQAPIQIDLEPEESDVPVSPVNEAPATPPVVQLSPAGEATLPDANRIEELFSIKGPKLPIVETITYKSRVSWQKGRPAWLADYARHYQTSRHFIARSLNGKPDYLKQDLVEGARFNVLSEEKNFKFHLIVDMSRCRIWFYYDDLDAGERVLLKTYQVGLGRIDPAKTSGHLTPLGQYSLGNKVAVYKPKMMGHYNGERTEMIGIFGTRWIPFDKELKGATAPAKGFGLHGVPWVIGDSGERVEDRSSIGKYQSDGCLRLASEDIEEIYAIVITRPTTIELVRDFFDAEQPAGKKETVVGSE